MAMLEPLTRLLLLCCCLSLVPLQGGKASVSILARRESLLHIRGRAFVSLVFFGLETLGDVKI